MLRKTKQREMIIFKGRKYVEELESVLKVKEKGRVTIGGKGKKMMECCVLH
jgi:hypothetical protein